MLQLIRKLFVFKNQKPETEKSPDARDFSQLLEETGLSFSQWKKHRDARPCLYPDLSEDHLVLLKKRFPHQVTATVKDAEQVLDHCFNLLGSGPFYPVDPDRKHTTEGYEPIDWYLDPVKNLRFPKGIHYKTWDFYTMRPGMADIKLPWELARCQHFAPLGQAFLLTGDPRYAKEIIEQINDFTTANPIGTAVNWTCTMDVAIRAANWAMGLAMIKRCDAIVDEEWEAAYQALYEHGRFIFDNFENTYEVTSNHYLSNIVGLYFLAQVFSGFTTAKRWREFCRQAIEEEIRIQILDDGADFESSIPYHRLVLELFLGAARIGEINGQPFSPKYVSILKKMTHFFQAVLQPDGMMPMIGDADDGRLHIFSDYGNWNPKDGRHILAPAAMLLDEPEWLTMAGEESLWEAAWWGFDIPSFSQNASRRPNVVKYFPNAGLALFREKKSALLISNSMVGTKGFGNHKHNDQLSFNLVIDNEPVIVDPGSYVYTSDPDARNLFRSTSSHNTVMIDGQEQNEMNPEWLFRLFETANAETVRFDETKEYVEYLGLHHGYERLAESLTHLRLFRFYKKKSILMLTDQFKGTGRHDFHWHFHFGPNIHAQQLEKNKLQLKPKHSDSGFFLFYPDKMTLALNEGEFSPAYGIVKPCMTADFSIQNTLVEEIGPCVFAVGPQKHLETGTDLLRRNCEKSPKIHL